MAGPVPGTLQARILEWVATSFSISNNQLKIKKKKKEGKLRSQEKDKWLRKSMHTQKLLAPESQFFSFLNSNNFPPQRGALTLESESVSESESRSVLSNSLPLHGLCSPWNSPGQNTGVGSLSLLQRIFPTQGSNLGLQHCRQILHQLSYKGSPLSCLILQYLQRIRVLKYANIIHTQD